MESWIAFWKYACIVGFGCFYLLAVVVIPLGARDLMRLFRRLSGRDGGSGESDTDTPSP